MGDELSHLSHEGAASMVDVSSKPVTRRTAEAAARVRLSRAAFEAACRGNLPKGDVFAVARLAGIAAAKRTADWIPLCHPLPLEHLDVAVTPDDAEGAFEVRARCTVTARTGCEMEALVAVSAAALALYDMVKAVDRAAVIGPVGLVAKDGGKSGTYRRDWPPGGTR